MFQDNVAQPFEQTLELMHRSAKVLDKAAVGSSTRMHARTLVVALACYTALLGLGCSILEKSKPVDSSCISRVGAAPPDGEKTWCLREGGVVHGRELSFFADGTHSSEHEYRDGARHGAWREFYAGGVLKSEEHYESGKPVGTWVTYFEDGTRASERKHADPEADKHETVELIEYRPDGTVARRGQTVGGHKDGTWVAWDEHGKMSGEKWVYGTRGDDAVADHAASETRDSPVALDDTGVPECNEYIAKYRRCINDKVPRAARGPMTEAMDASVKAWKEAASGPARGSLAAGCREALEAARLATSSMGCVW